MDPNLIAKMHADSLLGKSPAPTHLLITREGNSELPPISWPCNGPSAPPTVHPPSDWPSSNPSSAPTDSSPPPMIQGRQKSHCPTSTGQSPTNNIELGTPTTQSPSDVQSPVYMQPSGTYPQPPFWPPDLIGVITEVANTPSPAPVKPEFVFDFTNEAAEKNFLVLSKYDFDVEKAIRAQAGSPVGYGSEFRPTHQLEKVFSRHPNWLRMKSILENGSDWPLEDLDYETRLSDLEEALQFGNHKGASLKPELLEKLITKDVTKGFAFLLPRSKITRIPGALMAPMNIMNQKTIDEHGNIIGKDRLTHDQSFKFSSGTSVNSRVIKDQLLPCKFGNALRRLINWAVAARLKYPDKPIVACKIDYDSAYRRCHISGKVATQTCTQLPELDLAIMSLRLTFGGAPGPYEWGVISEAICDLAIAILQHDDWNPSELHAPGQDLVPPKHLMDSSIPLGQARELIVDIPVNPRGTADVYIDDTVGLAVDIEGSGNDTRLERAILLAIHVTARELHPSEPVLRATMAALTKLLAEARCEEIKPVLGWILDFHRLIASLPKNKFVAWSEAIQDMITRGNTTADELECNIGRMGHLGMILPSIHHFLSRLRDLHRRATSVNRRSVPIPEVCQEDLKLMLFFLEQAHNGISFNLIAYRRPTHVYRSDSCPIGLGGYSHEGWAWRFYIPLFLRYRASNNLLEHIASIITVWIDIIMGRLKEGDCSLSMTDSSTSEGWSRKTNFPEDGEDPIQATIRIEVARSHAMRLMKHGIKDYSQWFPGKENDVADALSRDDDRSDEELTHILRTFVPSQVPKHFEIVPLPNEISSWLTSLLQRLPVKEQLREKHTRTKLGRGAGGSNGVNLSDSKIFFSSPLTEQTESGSSVPLPLLCDKPDIRDQLGIHWLRAQSEVPSHLWFRPSGTMECQTPQRMMMGNLADFYLANSGGTETKTQIPNNKKPSPSAC